ncbi:DHHA1 domain-containing protein [Aneurinibacillus sp. Ricciae_BoGa-3]|uniref:alanyl-tRNA editing protein n=1 Tax=Aneurinibacillus sp. Ricciae_BoGa-3 TaxID=3022697 RepID=UPI00234107CB|nr:DHHA1 domain-containing protein [Aneurinibacillus sp. Ricciae_BoGa-3]WCK56226.1 DHHA1 domain-containing protein [Aneurinibacillus sp. Ricciae_BoGa-3]
MQHKLYYQDPYITEFTASLIGQGIDDNGRPYVILNQTAFYPTGGGQPYDTGELNGTAVIDVEEVGGQIRHILEHPLEHTQTVSGRINWKRRLDHMQQHTGQHILSASFEQLFCAATVGFHMGSEIVTIDLAISDLSWDLAGQAEELANRIVFENRIITPRFVESEELKELPLRKAPTVTENIRIVTIEGFDHNPCGGTHPARTGDVGPIKVLGWEKNKGNIRVEFVCGARTLQVLDKKQRILRDATRLLISSETELAANIERVLAERKNLEKQLGEANDKLLAYEADACIAAAVALGGAAWIQRIYSNRPLPELQKLAKMIADKEASAVVLLFSTGNRTQVVAARGTEVVLSAGDWIKEIMPFIGGKGGGSAAIAQGGAVTEIPAEEIVQYALDKLKAKLAT